MKAPRRRAREFSVQVIVCVVAMVLAGGVSGCSGGGGSLGSENGGGGQSPVFSLSVSPSSLTLNAESTASFQVSVTGSNGFQGTVALTVSGLPSGVTASPSSPTASSGAPAQITLSAGSWVTASSATVTLTGTAGSLTQRATADLTIKAAVRNVSLTRTRYVRTDSVTEYPLLLNSSWTVFNANTGRFFVTDPWGNQIVVMSAATEKEIASIPVPGAFGIDETPDGTLLYTGTLQGDVYAIDPVTMTVRHRYEASQIGPYGFEASSVRVLANGKLVLLAAGGNSVDGSGSFAIWDPSDNSIVLYGSSLPGSLPNCVRIGAFTLTGDRALIVEGSIDSDGTLCTIDPVTGAEHQVASGREFLYMVTPTPDGKSLLVPESASSGAGTILVFDSRTLMQTSSFPVAADVTSAASMIVSADSKTLYIYGGGVVYAYDIASGKLVGWTPYLSDMPISGGFNVGSSYGPEMQAMDGTGLIAGPMEEGVGFIDTSALETGPVGTQFLNGYASPGTGPDSGGTIVQLDVSSNENPVKVYFGASAASGLSPGSAGFSATTPPGSPGPVDIEALMADGGEQIIPEGFSYGPTILQATPDSSTSDGGGTGVLYGYGFGSISSSSIPAGLSITVGGQQATIDKYIGNAYGLASPPFPLEAVFYTIPPGTADTSADIEVQTSSGSTTLTGGMHYLPKPQMYPLAGAQLAQGVYDPQTDLYYFTDASEIRVFSRTEGKWLSPISVPAAPVGTTHRLWGIALSPDDSKLAVSDTGTAMIYVLDPDTPSSVQSFPALLKCFAGSCGTATFSSPQYEYPSGLAISDQGMVYFSEVEVGGSGLDGVLKLDTSSGKITDYRVDSADAMYRDAISSDNARVFFNINGRSFSIDTSTDTITYAQVSPGCCDEELTLSNNQTQLEAAGYLYDSDLNAESFLSLNDREALNTKYVYGAKLSPDGSLLFQPSVNGIDVFDGRLGTLRTRIALPFALSTNYDALVSDGTDNVLVAITGAAGDGVAVIDLSNLREPAPLPYIRSTARLSYAWQERASKPPHAAIPRSAGDSPGHVGVPWLMIPHAASSILPARPR